MRVRRGGPALGLSGLEVPAVTGDAEDQELARLRARVDQLLADESELAALYREALVGVRELLSELRERLGEEEFHRVAGRVLRLVEAGHRSRRISGDLLDLVIEAADRRTGGPGRAGMS